MLTATGLKRSELGAHGHKVVRCAGKQVLVIAQENRVFAIANRCPHEGYPLSEGTLGPGCALTCNWHNWKFDLESGEAMVGRDPVRTYIVGERGGEIFIDVSDPPAEELRARALDGIEAAIADNDRPRMAREVARLEHAGFDANDALVHGFRLRNGRLEDGMTHAYAAAADWLSLASRAATTTERLAALLEPLGHIAWDTEGEGEFPYPDAVAEWSGSGFVAAVEAEDEAAAIARVRGGLALGLTYTSMRAAIGEAVLAHYAGFGHCAIYTLKAGQLIEHLGETIAEPVLLALTRMLVRARREERLPDFAVTEQPSPSGMERVRQRLVRRILSGSRSRVPCAGPWLRRAARCASSTTRCWAPPRSTCCISILRSRAPATTRLPTMSAGSISRMR